MLTKLHILAPTVRDGVAHSLKKETIFSSTAKQNVHKIGVITFTEIYKEIIDLYLRWLLSTVAVDKSWMQTFFF